MSFSKKNSTAQPVKKQLSSKKGSLQAQVPPKFDTLKRIHIDINEVYNTQQKEKVMIKMQNKIFESDKKERST